MKFRVLVLGIGLALVSLDVEAIDPSAVDPSVIRIRTQYEAERAKPDGTKERVEVTAFGTGFVVTDDGHVVTNVHVISDPEALTEPAVVVADPADKLAKPARVIATDPEADIAILHVEGLHQPPLGISGVPPKKGTAVTAFGFPGKSDMTTIDTSLDPVIQPGIISRVEAQPTLRGASGRVLSVLLHSAVIGHGNSGGPLVDGCGTVVGVNTFATAGTVEENPGGSLSLTDPSFFYAVDVAELWPLLDRAGIKAHKVETVCEPAAAAEPDAPAGATSVVPGIGPLQIGLLVAALGGFFVIVTMMRRRKPAPVPLTTPVPASAPASFAPAKGPVWTLDGTDGDGNPIGIVIDGAAIAATDGNIVLGRAASVADRAIGGDNVSRRHLRFTLDGDRLMVEDLNSSNGTRVNGSALTPFVPVGVADGARIEAGGAFFTVRRTT